MSSGDLPSGQPMGRFNLVSVLKTLFYAILVPNGLIVGFVGLTHILSTLEIFAPYAAKALVGFLGLWAAIFGGLSGSAIVGWITAKRYGNRTPLLLLIPWGLLISPLYYIRPWEGSLTLVLVLLLIPALIFVVVGAVGTLIGVFANSIEESIPSFYTDTDGSK